MGKLYDDRGNRMSPSFSTKNGVRYRFYVSSALLRGRKADVGSVGRVPAAEIESAVLAALKTHQRQGQSDSAPASIGEVERVVIARDHLLITIAGTADGDGANQEFKIAWSMKARDAVPEVKDNQESESAPNEGLVQSVVRAHAWMHSLRDGSYKSIEHPCRSEPASSQRSFARRSASHSCPRTLHQPFWKAASRPGFHFPKSQNCFLYLGQHISR